MSLPRPVLVAATAVTGIVALALPAHADSYQQTGCTVAAVDSSTSQTGRTPLAYTTPYTSIALDPAAGRITGSATATWTPDLGAQEDCGVSGGYTDALRVGAGTSGLPDGALVTLRATFRGAGSVTATGDGGTHYAQAQLSGYFAVIGDSGCLECGPLVSADLQIQGKDTEYGGAADDSSSYGWDLQTADAWSSDYLSGVIGSTGTDSGVQTIEFPAHVGELLSVDARLSLLGSAANGTASATATVDDFSLTVSGVSAGVTIVPDGQTPPPTTQTPLDRIRHARELLAGYGIQHGVYNALDVKLAHAEQALLAGDDACADLTAFANQVEAQRGGKLTGDQADALESEVTAAMTDLAC